MLVKIGGVPEHYNIHWHLLIEKKPFNLKNFDVCWFDYSTGTGQLMKDIDSNKLDIAIVLTEGAIKFILEGCNAKIIDFYVLSPLIWGVYVSFNSFLKLCDIFEKRIGISRFGSGSHLIPIIHAKTVGEEIPHDNFVVVNDLEGALKAFEKNECDVFYWEKFTTNPFVKAHKLKCLGYFKSPWPSFVIVCNTDFGSKNQNLIVDIIEYLKNQIQSALKDDLIEPIQTRYNLDIDDINEWIKDVEWNDFKEKPLKKIEDVIFQLANMGILNQKILMDNILFEFNKS